MFDRAFTQKLLESIEDIESLLDGLLVEGDSFHSLCLLSSTFASKIRCIYIDPPYNTGIDGFVYKDSFKRSSWASFVFDRVLWAWHLLSPLGVLFSSINEIERSTLEHMLRLVFGEANRVEELIWVQDTVRNNSPLYSTNHEYIEVSAKSRATVEGRRDMFREPKPGYDQIMSVVTELNSRYAPLEEVERAILRVMKQHKQEYEEEIRQRGGDVAEARKNDPWKGIYPYRRVEYRSPDGKLVPETRAQQWQAQLWVWREVDPSMPSGKQSPTTKDPDHENFRYYKPPHPITGVPCAHPKRGWAFPHRAIGSRPSFDGYVADNRIVFKNDPSKPPQIKYFLHEVSDIVSTSVLRQYADGEQELESMFGRKGYFPNPKPVNLIRRLISQTCGKCDWILDFLAGSGTTGHAVLRSNDIEKSTRKYVLCEMGDYFSSVLKPRMLKAAYSDSWSAGVPGKASNRSHAFKYIRLESYEDALNNLKELRLTEKQATLLDTDKELREEYILSYMLDVESRGSQSLLNVEQFRNPDQYKLKVERNGKTKLVNVDLVETFNWLLGLTVKHIDLIRGVRVVDGTSPDGERVLVLWRNLDETDNDALDEWFEKQGYSTRDLEYDLVYVNGDNNLENLRRPDQTWKVRLIEEEFHRLMFDVKDV